LASAPKGKIDSLHGSANKALIDAGEVRVEAAA
jgi:hypothetical protein